MKKTLTTALVGTALLAATSAFAADAKENWDQLCAKCHAADGSGSTKMGKKLKVLDYTDAAVQAKFTDEHLAKVTLEGSTKDGKELMKGFKDDLTPTDVTALVAYIRQMKK
ncbi:MAG: cytochrome c [Verrucomicrobia bacterium]|nr:cytochrome c [Verrucomicrobiota bacterium]